MSLKELKEVFDATYTGTEKQNEEIYRKLMTREEINELIMTEDCIEMAYHLRFCPECQQGGIAVVCAGLQYLTKRDVQAYYVCLEIEVDGKKYYHVVDEHQNDDIFEADDKFQKEIDGLIEDWKKRKGIV